MFSGQIVGLSVSNPSEVTRSVELEDEVFIIVCVEWPLDIISDKVTQVCCSNCCYVLRRVHGRVLVTCRVFVINLLL